MTTPAELSGALATAVLAVPGVAVLYPSAPAAGGLAGRLTTATSAAGGAPHPVSVQRGEHGWDAVIVIGVDPLGPAPEVARAVAAAAHAVLSDDGGGRVTVRVASIGG